MKQTTMLRTLPPLAVAAISVCCAVQTATAIPQNAHFIGSSEPTASIEGKTNVAHRDTINTDTAASSKNHIWCELYETMPGFRGGVTALREWIDENMHYPDELADTCLQGRVIVTFIINEDGTLSNAKVIKSVHPLLDAEALRLVSIMPRWYPAKRMGKGIKIKYCLPFSFIKQTP